MGDPSFDFAAPERDPMAMILVVEDDAFIREIAEVTIQDLHHQILSAADVPEALAILRSDIGIDALFTDIYLKRRMNGGCEVAHEAARLRPQCRVLYTSGNRLTASMTQSFLPGSEFLPKPYTALQLEASISHILAR